MILRFEKIVIVKIRDRDGDKGEIREWGSGGRMRKWERLRGWTLYF